MKARKYKNKDVTLCSGKCGTTRNKLDKVLKVKGQGMSYLECP